MLSKVLFKHCLFFVFLPIVVQLHREFQRAGADVLQALTFYASEDKLENRGNRVGQKYSVCVCAIALELPGEHSLKQSTCFERSRFNVHKPPPLEPRTFCSVRVSERGGL